MVAAIPVVIELDVIPSLKQSKWDFFLVSLSKFHHESKKDLVFSKIHWNIYLFLWYSQGSVYALNFQVAIDYMSWSYYHSFCLYLEWRWILSKAEVVAIWVKYTFGTLCWCFKCWHNKNPTKKFIIFIKDQYVCIAHSYFTLLLITALKLLIYPYYSCDLFCLLSNGNVTIIYYNTKSSAQ